MNIERYINLSKALIGKVPDKREKHFTFILKNGGKVVSIGWNNPLPSNKAKKMGYEWADIHSELDSILKLGEEDCKRYTLVNIRLNRFGKIGMSKPCKTCQKVLQLFKFKKVYYSVTDSTTAERL